MTIAVEKVAARASGGVDLVSLSEENLSWTKAGDIYGVTEEALLATRSLITAVGHEMWVIMKGCVKLLHSLAGELRSKRSKCDATIRQLQ